MQEAAYNTTPVTVMMLSPGSHSKHVSLSRSAKSVIFKESLKPCLINTQCLSFGCDSGFDVQCVGVD